MGFDRSEIPAEQDGARIIRETIDLLKTELSKDDLDSLNIRPTVEPDSVEAHREETGETSCEDTKLELLEEEKSHQEVCDTENMEELEDGVEADTEGGTIRVQNECETSVQTCQGKVSGVEKENFPAGNNSKMDNLAQETLCKQDGEQSQSTGQKLNESSTSVCCPAEDSFDPEIVFLGTGASLPSKYRNVSCTLVRIR